MKVLAVSVPGSGHVNPLMPLINSLVAAGDEVVVASALDPGGVVAQSGAEFRAVGHGEMEWFGALQARTRGFPGDGLAPERINYYFIPRLFGDVAAADMIDDVLACGRDLRPDVVLFETYAFAAPLAADVLGVPAIHHLISPMLPRPILELANDAVSPLWRSFGRDAPGYAGIYRDLTIEVSPRSLDTEQVPSGESVQLRPAPLPLQRPAPSNPPLVYVTLGTFFGQSSEVFRAILDGLAGEDVEVIVTVGADQDPADLSPVPPNARVERFIPQAELMPRCSAVVHHGGSGTMFGSLAHGLAQVVVPQGADNFLNADLVANAGAGISLVPDQVTPELVRSAVRAVLSTPSHAAAAKTIAGDIAAMPGPDEIARILHERYG